MSVAVGMMFAPGIALAQKGGGKGGGGNQTNFKVCVEFDNLETDGILSDDLPPPWPPDSTPYCNKVDRVLAIVGDGFRLDTTKGSRELLLDFGQDDPLELGSGMVLAGVDMRIAKQYLSDPVTGELLDSSGAPVAPGDRFSAGHRLAVGSMTVGEVARGALSIRFFFVDASGNEQIWVLGFADVPGPGGGRNCPFSAPVKVTRVSAIQWRIETVAQSLDEPFGGVACLWGDTAVVATGLFSMPFGIRIDAL